MEEQVDHEGYASAGGLASSWLRSSRHITNSFGHLYNSFTRANRAMFPMTRGTDSSEQRPADAPELTYTLPGWEMERTTDSWNELGVGDSVRFSKVVDDEDVRAFARVSGDTNRLHLDDDHAESTRFGRRIVHGTLVSGLISAALARLPGLTIYLSQDLEFLKPVDIGDRLTAVVEVVEDIGDNRYRLTTSVENEEGALVIDGEAVVIIDELPNA